MEMEGMKCISYEEKIIVTTGGLHNNRQSDVIEHPTTHRYRSRSVHYSTSTAVRRQRLNGSSPLSTVGIVSTHYSVVLGQIFNFYFTSNIYVMMSLTRTVSPT